MRRALASALAVVIVAASCSGGDDSGDESPADTTVPADPAATDASDSISAAPETTGPTGDTEDASPATSAAPDADVADDEATPPSTAPLIDGVEPSVELLTPLETGEIRPLLAWSPVGDAAYYLATLYAPDGTPYWSWTGPATSVPVGGEPKLSDDVPGPSVVAGMTWGVVALDDALVPIAASDRRTIAP